MPPNASRGMAEGPPSFLLSHRVVERIGRFRESLPSLDHGQEIQKSEKGQRDQLGPSLASDIHQAAQAAVWSEQVPNALAHLQQRSRDRVRPGVPGSPLSSKQRRLNGRHAETHRKACRETNAKHRRVSSGSHCKCDGSFREAQKKGDLA